MTCTLITMGRAHRLAPFSAILFALGLTFSATAASAQTTGPDSFTSTESALTGTVACNTGAPTAIAPVDASSTIDTGTNDAQASNLSATACGLPLYSFGAADNSTNASDTPGQDDGTGTSTSRQVSLLGGIVTFDNKSESDACSVTDTQGDVSCSSNTTIENLHFGGQAISGSFSQLTTFQATNLQVQLLGGGCTGLALFTGTMTLNVTSTQGQGTNHISYTHSPLALQGTLTCVGLPLTSIRVDLQDADLTEAQANSLANLRLSIENAAGNVSANPPAPPPPGF